jgi:hypothetical protein
MVRKWFRQLFILLYKNYLLAWRARRSTAVQLLAPLVLIAVLFLIQLARFAQPFFFFFFVFVFIANVNIIYIEEQKYLHKS